MALIQISLGTSEEMCSAIDRDDVVDAFEYLDGLRDSGIVNMFGAAPYLAHMFGYDKEESGYLLKGWMETFDAMLDVSKRADAFLSNA